MGKNLVCLLLLFILANAFYDDVYRCDVEYTSIE